MPSGATHVIIHVVSGNGNYISNNHIAATTEMSKAEDAATGSCFSAQAGTLLAADKLEVLDVIAVWIEKESLQNTVLDSGNEVQVVMDKTVNACRATPTAGA